MSANAPKIECREAGADAGSPWHASVQFNATGTVASVSLRKDKAQPISLRSSFDYKSYDQPVPKDEYSFKTSPDGQFVLTSQTGTSQASAVWRQGNKNYLFDCTSGEAESNSANTTPPPPGSATGSDTLRCYEASTEGGWEMEVRIDSQLDGTPQAKISSEVTLQREGEAPSIRRAALIRDTAGTDDQKSQFSLVLSRNERFEFNLKGPAPKATWSRGATTTEFTCPQVIAH